MHFNSFTVRLKEMDAVGGGSPYGGFQFLHGAIKRSVHTAAEFNEIVFQFLHGAIKRLDVGRYAN